MTDATRAGHDAPVADAANAVSETGEACQQSAARPPRVTKQDPDRVRLCIVTRQELPPAQLIRFVADPDGIIVPDLARRLPGRGVWVTATREAVATAAKRGLFAKNLKKPVKADKELADQVEKLLAAEARQVLSLANKAGLVTTGFSKVDNALAQGEAIALIAANDASIDGAGKLARKFKAVQGAKNRAAPVIQDFTIAELSLAIGGSNVVHAALAGGGLSRRVVTCCQRLRIYRMHPDSDEVDGSNTGSLDVVAQPGSAD